jgi:hypothetical protein
MRMKRLSCFLMPPNRCLPAELYSRGWGNESRMQEEPQFVTFVGIDWADEEHEADLSDSPAPQFAVCP